MLEWGVWKAEMWFQEARISPQLKHDIIINGSEHCSVDRESPRSVSQAATVPHELPATRLSLLPCLWGSINTACHPPLATLGAGSAKHSQRLCSGKVKDS